MDVTAQNVVPDVSDGNAQLQSGLGDQGRNAGVNEVDEPRNLNISNVAPITGWWTSRDMAKTPRDLSISLEGPSIRVITNVQRGPAGNIGTATPREGWEIPAAGAGLQTSGQHQLPRIFRQASPQ